MGEEITVFHDDDEAYEDWVARHGGYVLTERAEPRLAGHRRLQGYEDPEMPWFGLCSSHRVRSCQGSREAPPGVRPGPRTSGS